MESTVKVVWPTIGATAAGRLVGRLAGLHLPGDRFHLLGRLLAFATIPISLAVFVWQLLPITIRRYRLTTRRIIIEKGLRKVEGPAIGLDEFDAIDVVVLPGQQWLWAGELCFQREGREVFRLSGVSRPEVFRVTCLKAQLALVSVREVLCRQS
jgi:hypothetical protein